MLAVLGLGLGEMLLILAALSVAALAFGFWIWMLIDCIRNPAVDSNEKLIWVLVIALTHFIGALIYFAVVRLGRVRPPQLS